MTRKLDVLAYAPHPDDVEMSCGGILAKLAAAGHRVGIVDMTQGELGTNGSVVIRQQEAAAAAAVLGIHHRENLSLPDGHIDGQARPNDEQLLRVVDSLRRHRPDLILIPYWEERHPDHVQASELLTRAVFYSGLQQFECPTPEPFTPLQVLYYMMRFEFRPSFVVDISEVGARKLDAVRCFNSQISREKSNSGGMAPTDTLINSRHTLSVIDARDRYFGAMIGASHGEPFLMRNTLSIANPLKYFRKFPGKNTLLYPVR